MKHGPQKRLAVAAAVLAGVIAAGCGEKEESVRGGETTSLELMLDFFVNPDHAGIYTALENGHFEEAGLEVTPRVPSDPATPIKLVASGQADLAVSYEPEVLLARDQGLPVIAVAAIVPQPLTSLISLPDAEIEEPSDLRDKTIATAGIPYQDAYLKTILARANLSPADVKTVNVGFGLLPAILGGRAQAMLGGFRNVEGVDLRLRGKAPVVTPVDQLGVPTYDELVLVAQRQQLEEDPQAIRLFIAALARGTEAAANNPQAATKALLEANPDLDPKLTRAEVAATLPLLDPPRGERPYGYMSPTRWREFTGWMRDNEVIASLPPTASVLSNAYLPGAEIPE